MTAFGSVDELLDFAIEKEEEAAQFYTDLAGKMDKPHMKQVFTDFAGEEKKHKEKVMGIKEGKLLLPVKEKVMDLKIAEYVVDVEASPDMDYQAALIMAMKKEKASFKLYNDLAAQTDNETVRSTMLIMAQEEAKHKMRLEIEYDDNFLDEPRY
jgi:rubrerythrin